MDGDIPCAAILYELKMQAMQELDKSLGVGTYEQKVYAVLKACLSEGESVEIHPQFDFYAPKGIKKLKWKAKTAIEVKFRLIYDTLSKIKYQYDNKSSDVDNLVVVYFEAVSSLTSSFLPYMQSLYGRDISIKSYEDLCKIGGEPSYNENKSKNSNVDQGIKDKILTQAKESIRKDRISLFLGAGVSASAGVVTWDKLIEQLCIKKDLSKLDSDIADTIKGRYIINRYKGANKELSEEFYEDIKSILYSGSSKTSELLGTIAKVVNISHIESIITYNYDDLLEQAIETKKCHAVYDKSRPNEGSEIQIYHVHGYLPHTGRGSDIILGEKEYHKIYQEAYSWGNVEQLHALCRSTCFFIGLSMKDPNLRRLLDIAADGGNEREAVHFAFLREIEHNIPFTEEILRSFGISCIWYKQHKDLPKLLENLIDD